MKRIVWILAVAVVVAAATFAGMHFLGAPAGRDLSREKASDKGVYRVAIAPESEPVRQGTLHAWLLTLKTPDGRPVEDAAIQVDGGMPEHGHGLSNSPAVSGYLGDGKYRIDGIRFNMSGWWELKFAITAAPGDDSVVFNIVL